MEYSLISAHVFYYQFNFVLTASTNPWVSLWSLMTVSSIVAIRRCLWVMTKLRIITTLWPRLRKIKATYSGFLILPAFLLKFLLFNMWSIDREPRYVHLLNQHSSPIIFYNAIRYTRHKLTHSRPIISHHRKSLPRQQSKHKWILFHTHITLL